MNVYDIKEEHRSVLSCTILTTYGWMSFLGVEIARREFGINLVHRNILLFSEAMELVAALSTLSRTLRLGADPDTFFGTGIEIRHKNGATSTIPLDYIFREWAYAVETIYKRAWSMRSMNNWDPKRAVRIADVVVYGEGHFDPTRHDIVPHNYTLEDAEQAYIESCVSEQFHSKLQMVWRAGNVRK